MVESIFEFRQAKTNRELEEIFRIRYKAYKEIDYVPEEECPGGLEKDKFDEYAISFYCLNKNENSVVGTIRLVSDNPLGFPVEELFPVFGSIEDRLKTVEVSRRITYPLNRPMVNFGLIHTIFQYCQKNRLDYWIASGNIDDKPFYDKLGFTPMGEPKYYERAKANFYPMILNINKMNERFRKQFIKEKDNIMI